jgi:hypothetical protein
MAKGSVKKQMQRINAASASGRRFVMHLNGSLSTGAGGLLQGTIDVGDISTFSDYTNEFGTLYDEFRVIGGVLNFYSTMGPGHTNACSIMAVAFDNDNNTGNPASINEVIQYGTSKTFNCGRDAAFTYEFMRPKSMNLWYDIASASNSVCGIRYYATTLSASTTYYNIEVEILVEFRGRR